MKRLFIFTCLSVLIASLMSCQKDNGISFESIYPSNYITKIEVKDKNGKINEINNLDTINEWTKKVSKIKFIRDKNQNERELLLIYNGCLVNVFHRDNVVGDFNLRKLRGVYYKENTVFDKQVKELCK